jgi:hypothetical protein
MTLPTFDEWHMSKYGMTFETRSMPEAGPWHLVMRDLADEGRAYLSEMVALMEQRCSTPEPASPSSAEASPPPARANPCGSTPARCLR